jgi:hypothetical protein
VTRTKKETRTRRKPKPEVDREMETIRLKTEDKGELWIEFFQMVVPLLLGDEINHSTNLAWMKDRLVLGSEMADKALELFEDRWGKG